MPLKILKSAAPMASQKMPSKYSIQFALNPLTAIEEDKVLATVSDKLPAHHFTETDLHEEWTSFLKEIRSRDMVLYNAVSGFRFSKKDEGTVLISHPSDSAKLEFEKIHGEFLNHFKRKVSNYQIKFEFAKDESLKQEIVTKRQLFEKFAEINPLLRELDEFMKFDFS